MGTLKLNLYFRDGVESFTVYAANSGSITYTRASITNPTYNQVTVSGFSSPVRITCNLQSGYYLAYWQYRYPTVSSTLNYNWNNPITFQNNGSSETDCYLTPIATTSWEFMRLSARDVSNLSGTTVISSLTIHESVAWLIQVTTASNGVLTATASNSAFDTFGWIADASTGEAIGTYTNNYSGYAFQAKANVSSGRTYWIVVRSQQHVKGIIDITLSFSNTSRPNDWAWSSTVSKGASVTLTKTGTNTYNAAYLTAAEWNGFVDRVKAFATYKGVSMTASNYYVTKGAAMQAATAEGIRQIISSMSPSVAVPSQIYSGKGITAADINGLKNSLNSIW